MEPTANPQDEIMTGEKEGNIVSAFVGVFSSPGKVFSQPFNKFAWVAPLLVIAVIATVLGHLTKPIYFKDLGPMMLENIEKYKSQMPAEDYEEARGKIEQVIADAKENKFEFKYIIASILFPLGIMLVVALIGMMSGNFFFAGKSGFWALMNVVAFAALIGILGDIARSAMILSKGTMYVYTGLGILSPINDGTFSYYLMRQIDAFTIWRIIVTAIGFGAVYKMKSAKFAYILFPIWLIMISLVAGANLFTGGSIIY